MSQESYVPSMISNKVKSRGLSDQIQPEDEEILEKRSPYSANNLVKVRQKSFLMRKE